MEKRDYIVIVVAILIVLILAVFVKPMLTGQQVVFLPASPPSPTEKPIEQGLMPTDTSPSHTPVQEISQISSAPTQSEVIPTSKSQAAEVIPEVTPMTWQPDPANPMPAIQMINYAEIIGKYTGKTEPFRIPTPYWELNYNVTPLDNTAVFLIDIYKLNNKEEIPVRSFVWHEGVEPNPQDLRFFEGGRDYYLNITAEKLKEYKIVIKIPLKYIRDT